MTKQMLDMRSILTPSSEDPNRMVLSCPQSVGTGYSFLQTFSSGLKLLVADINCLQPVSFFDENQQNTLGMSFIVRGQSEAFSPVYPQSIPICSGLSGYFIFPEPAESGEHIMPGPYRRVWILMEPATLNKMAEEDEDIFAPFLLGQKSKTFQTDFDDCTAFMTQTVEQIFSCPYQGKTRSFFLEGKMLELLACKLEQMRNRQQKSFRHPASLKPEDREKVHQAAKIMEQKPDIAPDLRSLGRAVGLSRSKFHACFCQEFGQTPLEYLRDIRLNKAKQLLEQRRCNVTEAACMVGYSNPSYFARLFREHYHLCPGDLLR